MINETIACDICQHKDICKWCDEMNKKQRVLKELVVFNSKDPIVLSITCTSFQRIVSEIQEGFFFMGEKR